MYPSYLKQGDVLSTLSQIPATTLKSFTEAILEDLGQVSVIQNRTGLVMLPYRDSAQGELFHLGEVLIAEAHIKLELLESKGYAACLGRDLEQALAMAIIDASLNAEGLQDVMRKEIEDFIAQERQKQEEHEQHIFKQVEATRVEMETF